MLFIVIRYAFYDLYWLWDSPKFIYFIIFEVLFYTVEGLSLTIKVVKLSLVQRLQVINVYDPEYESAGAFWPHVHGRIIAALILEHITLIGIFLIKGPVAFVQSPTGGSIKSKILRYVRDSCSSTPFMIALPVLTLVFHHYCKKRFEAAFKNYPLEVSYA